MVAEGDLIQQSGFPSREAPAGASISADNAFNAAETHRLQQEAQARIEAGRHDTIGVAP